MNIELGKKVLADFAIYEPRTFQVSSVVNLLPFFPLFKLDVMHMT